MENVLTSFLDIVTIICMCLIFLALIRAIKGPGIADRIMAVNMIGTQVIIIIALLVVRLDEGWLADVAAVYAAISFIGVVVFTKIYIGEYREKQAMENGTFPLDVDDGNGDKRKAVNKPFIAGEINLPKTRQGKKLPDLPDDMKGEAASNYFEDPAGEDAYKSSEDWTVKKLSNSSEDRTGKAASKSSGRAKKVKVH